MNVLSLFDGMSCGRVALERAGFTVTNYYASEVDKYAIKVAMANYPETIQIGDVTKVSYKDGYLTTENGVFYVGQIDLLIGGSPCQGFSFAGKQLNFEDPRSKLFFEFTRLMKEIQPANFLLENVKMKQECQDVISLYTGVQPIEINSALVSAQNRKRLYWTNLTIQQPEDKGVLLQDIIQQLDSVDKRFVLSENELSYMNRAVNGGRNHWDFGHHSSVENEKSSCVVSNFSKGVPYNVLVDREKSFCITSSVGRTTMRESFYKNQGGVAFTKTVSRGDFSSVDGVSKIETIVNGIVRNESFKLKLPNGSYVVRKYTPIECERLQTLPDNYTNHVSSTQRYKMIGNGWTVDVISHIFKNLSVASQYHIAS